MVLETVKDILKELIGVSADEITLDTELAALKVDSIDKAEIVTELEEKFSIIIDYDEALKVKKVGDIVGAVEKLLK